MRCLIQSLQVQKIRFQKVPFATIRLKHTTRYWWSTHTHSPADSLDLQMINADTNTNKHTQTINADTRTLMLQPYQMPYVKLLWCLHNWISFNCKYYRSFTSNVCLMSTYTRKLNDVKSNAFLTMKSSTPQLVPNKCLGFSFKPVRWSTTCLHPDGGLMQTDLPA